MDEAKNRIKTKMKQVTRDKKNIQRNTKQRKHKANEKI